MSKPDEKLQARGGDMDAPERVMVSWTTKGRAVASAPISAGLLHTIGATEYIRADLAAPDLAELVEALRIAGPIALGHFANHPFILNEDEKRKVAVISAALAKIKEPQT